MAIQKIELDASPQAYEVLSVQKTNYRSGQRYEIAVRFCWKVTPAGAKFTCYTETVTVQWDRASDTVANLKARAQAAMAALKTADTSEADTIYALLNLQL